MMHPDKVKNVLLLSVQERYNYMIRKVADFEEVWLIRNSDGLIQTVLLENEIESVPVWPEKEFAEQMLVNKWRNCSTQFMDIYEFMDWLDQLSVDNLLIAAFPLPNLDSIKIDPLEFKKHLKEECSQYE